MPETTYRELNAEINLWDENGKLQLEKDKEAARAYFLEEVNQNTVFFHNIEEKIDYLTTSGFWDRDLFYDEEGRLFPSIPDLFRYAYGFKFRFPTFFGAYKFYNQYALKTPDGKRWLERYEDRVVLNALAYGPESEEGRERVIEAIITGRFQPATPTFMNAGRAFGGEPVSCFLMRMEDNMESISRTFTNDLQLSKRGGGVAMCLTNIREAGAPIQKMEGQSSGVVPIMKIMEDSFSYANQLGARQGAGAVYLSAHHPDIMAFLDTKRENADEKIRIKTLSLGVVIPDITFELAKRNEDMYLFSPYDVERVFGKPFSEVSVTKHYYEMLEDSRISKSKINARRFFQTLAEIQFESGYPYIMFEDTANRANPAPNVGRIIQSNLCSEIMQPSSPSTYNEDGSYDHVGRDISCNLASLNIAQMMKLGGHDFMQTVETAYLFLTKVAETSNLAAVPPIENGNKLSRAIGLGQMNLHGYLIEQGIEYDSEEARAFFDTYMANVTYGMIWSSAALAGHVGESFDGFHGSNWENGEKLGEIEAHFSKLSSKERERWNKLNLTSQSWVNLGEMVKKQGLYNMHLQAIPPTGSISYINNSTSSIHPITAPIEIRKEGRSGRVYYPAYGLTSDNVDKIKDAYEIGPEAIIKMYAAAAPYVDQGQSLTLFFKDTATTRDINRAQISAHKSGVKSIYYIRLRQKALAGTEVDGCVSCML